MGFLGEENLSESRLVANYEIAIESYSELDLQSME
jgi:hypothetical protein